MKLPIKSIGMFVCGAVVASLPYTLSLGKANAQGTTTSSAGSSTNSSASSSGFKSAQSSTSGSQNAFGSKSAGSNVSGGQNGFGESGSGSNGSSSAGSGISALTNDEVYLYASSGDRIFTIRKSDHQIVDVLKVPSTQASSRNSK